MISFTERTKIGVEIAQASAVTLKQVGLKLGGKPPHLVFADADIDAALPVRSKVSWGRFVGVS